MGKSSQQDADKQIIAGLDLRAEFIELGVKFTQDTPKSNGWLSCYAVGREDASPSAGCNLITGRYNDFAGENLSFFDFAAKHSKVPVFASWRVAREHYATKAGVELPKKKIDPFKNLQWVDWNQTLVLLWVLKRLGQKAIDRGVTPAILQALGFRLARYRRQFSVLALPVFGVNGTDASPKAYVLWNVTGGTLPVFKKGQAEPVGQVKMKSIGETGGGLLGAFGVNRLSGEPATVWKLEGATDPVALFAAIPEDLRSSHLVVANAGGSREHVQPGIAALFTGHRVNVVHDTDEPGVIGAEGWQTALTGIATAVRTVHLPYPVTEKHGSDLRNYIHDDGHSFEDLLLLAESAPVERADADPEASSSPPSPTVIEDEHDPHRLARVYLSTWASHSEHGITLRYWRDEWWRWDGLRYRRLTAAEIRSELTTAIKTEFDRLNVIAQQAPASDKGPPIVRRVTRSIVADVLNALQSIALAPSSVDQPSWLQPLAVNERGISPINSNQSPSSQWPPGEVFVASNGLLHLPTLSTAPEGDISFLQPLTPAFFSPNAVPYEFVGQCDKPQRWCRFLEELWPHDDQAIDALQEWFGYCLLPDNRHQKILMIVGPKRSGKGTIARILKALIGEENTTSPGLSSLGSPFGLQDLLGKTLAIMSDARLSARSDHAVILENLLRISGEDDITVDRKNLPAISTRLLTRFVILTNELPNLRDSSGAFASRLLMLRTQNSFYEKEDKNLEAALRSELTGILTWAIMGWERLQANQRFTEPNSSKEVIEEMTFLGSPCLQFVNDRCQVSLGCSAPLDTLWEEWREWCKEENREPRTKQWLSRELIASVPSIRRSRQRSGDKRETWYDGIAVLQRVGF